MTQIIVPLLPCHLSHAALRLISLILVFSLSMIFFFVFIVLGVFCVSWIYTCKLFNRNREISAIISPHMSYSFCDSTCNHERPDVASHTPQPLFFFFSNLFLFSSSVCVTSVDVSSGSSCYLHSVAKARRVNFSWWIFISDILFFSSRKSIGIFHKFYFSVEISCVFIHYEYTFLRMTEHSFHG